MTERTQTRSPPSGNRGGATSGFRPDIEGFRAIAVGVVVAFHAGVPAIGGGYVGVDVFYVISGFLITGLLERELRASGTIQFARFYLRRALRLLPMALLVLVAIAGGMLIFTPPVYRPAVRLDEVSAMFYYANWQFALESVNYLGFGSAANPVLHYWSLSVEEQFYLVWPLLLIAAALVRSPIAVPLRLRLAVMLGALGAASLAYSIVHTPAEPAIAYFETTTRAWEFAVGGAVALALPWIARLPRRLAPVLGLAGIAAVLGSALAYGPTTELPGSGGDSPRSRSRGGDAAGVVAPATGVGALLGLRPMRYVGRISYSWYLWHWPCLVFAGVAGGTAFEDGIGYAKAALAVAVSFALAAATYPLVEQRARHARWLAGRNRRVLTATGAMVAVALVAVVVAGGPLGRSGNPFAYVIPSLATPTTAKPMTPLDATESTPYSALHGCHVGYGTTAPPAGCVFGDRSSPETIALIGDSHAAQWYPALEQLANHQRLRLIVWTKSGCPFADGILIYLPAIGREYSECAAWQRAVLARLRALPRPTLVIVGRTATYLPQVLAPDGDQVSSARARAIWGADMAAGVEALRSIAKRVLVLRDPPRPPYDVPACLSWDPDHPALCDFRRSAGGVTDDAEYAAERSAGVPARDYVNTTPIVCPGRVCHVMVGGLIVYRDDNHLTAAFVASRWHQFVDAINRALKHRPI